MWWGKKRSILCYYDHDREIHAWAFSDEYVDNVAHIVLLDVRYPVRRWFGRVFICRFWRHKWVDARAYRRCQRCAKMRWHTHERAERLESAQMT